MVNIETVPCVYARIENHPGALERTTRVLSDKRINVDAFSLETNGSLGFARIVTHKTREAVEALKSQGVDAYESNLVVAQIPNRMGELQRACGELAAAGLNIEAAMTTPEGKLAFRTNDNERAANVLRKL